jgi:NAD dependent epimerase/dehydratase family enzyme
VGAYASAGPISQLSEHVQKNGIPKSRWVQPQKLLDAVFAYSQPELGRALLQIAKKR